MHVPVIAGKPRLGKKVRRIGAVRTKANRGRVIVDKEALQIEKCMLKSVPKNVDCGFFGDNFFSLNA